MTVTRLGREVIKLTSGMGTSDQVPSGGSAGQVVTSNGSNGAYWGENIARITANGSNASPLVGPFVNFAAGSNITLAWASNSLTIHGSAAGGASVSYGSNSNDVSLVSAAGASTLVSRADHVHRGVHLVTANGSNTLYGDVNLKAGTGIALGVSGQDVTITNTGVPGPAGAGAAGTTVTVARVETNQTTTSTTYTDLATAGPSVTVTVPASGKVRVSIAMGTFPSTTTATAMGVVLSGANTLAAADDRAAIAFMTSAGFMRIGVTIVYSGLTPGSTTFKAQYRTNAGTGNFQTREISAEPVS